MKAEDYIINKLKTEGSLRFGDILSEPPKNEGLSWNRRLRLTLNRLCLNNMVKAYRLESDVFTIYYRLNIYECSEFNVACQDTETLESIVTERQHMLEFFKYNGKITW